MICDKKEKCAIQRMNNDIIPMIYLHNYTNANHNINIHLFNVYTKFTQFGIL